MDYHVVEGIETMGPSGHIGIRISLAGVDRKLTEAEEKVLWDAREAIHDEIIAGNYANNPKAKQAAKEEREGILACFPDSQKIFVKEIPNGYCSRGCCRHLPWFEVTTPKGVVTIGWRKRVISITWSANVGASTLLLFPNEDVTKSEYGIHAWGYAKAKEYLAKLLA